MAKDTGKVNIHGKEYLTVAKRVSDFRSTEGYGDYSIETEIVDRDEATVVMKATIKNEEGRIIATGHAEESRTASTINRTSALENCETSAIGRALASFGLAGTEFASADEVAGAINLQKNNISVAPKPADPQLTKLKKEILDKLTEKKLPNSFIGDVLAKKTVDSVEEANKVLDNLV